MLAFMPSSAQAITRPEAAGAPQVRLAVQSGAQPLVPAAAAAPALEWGVLLAQLNIQGSARELAKHCTLESFTEGRLVLNLAPQQKHMLSQKMAQEKLQAALTDYFAQPVRLTVTLAASNIATPAAAEQQEKLARQQQATAAIMQDPFVREAQAQLGAQVIEDSIKPV
jgi:DNA polymerase-3 subunit gamma/tau